MSPTAPSPRSRDSALYRFVVFIWGVLPLPGPIRGLILGAGNSWFLVGANAVVLDGDRVLIAKHTYRRLRPWGLPAGLVRQGEDPAAAVRREVEEETGFVVEVGPPVTVGLVKDPPHLDVAYLCYLRGGRFVPCAEVSDARFVSIADAERQLPRKDLAHVHAALQCIGCLQSVPSIPTDRSCSQHPEAARLPDTERLN